MQELIFFTSDMLPIEILASFSAQQLAAGIA